MHYLGLERSFVFWGKSNALADYVTVNDLVRYEKLAM